MFLGISTGLQRCTVCDGTVLWLKCDFSKGGLGNEYVVWMGSASGARIMTWLLLQALSNDPLHAHDPDSLTVHSEPLPQAGKPLDVQFSSRFSPW